MKEFDGKVFTRIICWVGKDTEYACKAINIIISKGYTIDALAGENALQVLSIVSIEYKGFDPEYFNEKRPWLNEKFEQLLLKEGILGINCGFDYIIPKTILDSLPTANLHPSALPYNRGCHHSFWGIIDKTDLGATMHWMTAELDNGPIIAQKIFSDDGLMTADFIQKQSNELCLELLCEHLDGLMRGRTKSIPQKAGTYHNKNEIKEKSTLKINDFIKVGDLLDMCRATNNKGHGFYIVNGKLLIRIVIKSIEIADNSEISIASES